MMTKRSTPPTAPRRGRTPSGAGRTAPSGAGRTARSGAGRTAGFTRRELLVRGAAAAALPVLTRVLPLTGAAPAFAAAGPVLRFGIAEADVGTADPHYASGTQDRALVDMIFNGLLRYKPGDGTVFEPDLAAEMPRPAVVAGKQVWTFRLRRGVMFHPSERVPAYELTSDDVVFSLQNAADRARSAYAGQYTGITAQATDRYTVGVIVDTPVSQNLFYPLVSNYAGGFIVSRRAVETYGLSAVKTRPVGTGPFVFRSYSPKERVELAPNAQYFRGHPQLGGVDYRYVADVFSRELGLRGGQLDAISGAQDEAWINKMQAVANMRRRGMSFHRYGRW